MQDMRGGVVYRCVCVCVWDTLRRKWPQHESQAGIRMEGRVRQDGCVDEVGVDVVDVV